MQDAAVSTTAGATPVALWRRLLPSELNQLAPGPLAVILAIALAGFLLRLFFWWYTGRVWEDALITVLHSENFANGLGLTHYHPGAPPLHGFTSPASVLIPLAADIFHAGWGLSFIKIVSAILVVPTVLLAAAITRHPRFGVNIWLTCMLCAYLAFEHQQILYGMAGMETQVVCFALFYAMYQALHLRPVRLGLAMALCVYARPDFAILVAVLALYVLVVDWRVLKTALPVAAVAYAPWVIFTTLYYGSPVPNTIVAKGLYQLWWKASPPSLSRLLGGLAQRIDLALLPLGPWFAGHGIGYYVRLADHGWIARLCGLLIVLGASLILAQFHRSYLLPLGAFAAYALYYIFLVPQVAAWYLPPFGALSCLVLVLSLSALLHRFISPRNASLVAGLLALAYIAPFVALLPTSFRAEHDIQLYIETPVREAMGKYLFEHKKPGDRVSCEPLGYIAYYSRMPVYDFPGLANRDVTQFLKNSPPRERSLRAVLEHFRPEWIALREREYENFTGRRQMRFLESEYQIEKIFRADPRADHIFRARINIDRVFYLLHRRS